jgi:muconolactone delta-isomerase
VGDIASPPPPAREFLVTMTTHIPAGTPPEAVDGIRAREAAHTRDLAAQGHVLRLWRPPLAPGEWRTLGLFAAADPAELEQVLASMPLRIWRSDEIQELAPHPNDPPRAGQPDQPPAAEGTATEYLVTFTPTTASGTPDPAPPGTPVPDSPVTPAPTSDPGLAAATAQEAERARELARQGHLIRLWTLPAEQTLPVDHGRPHALGLWRATSDAGMQSILASLPMRPYLITQATRLAPHPSDPAAPGSRPRGQLVAGADPAVDHGRT